MRSLTFAMLFATISTSAIASSNYAQDARDLSASALCGATNVTCQQSYTSGAKDGTAAFKRLYSTYKAIRAAEVPPAPPPPSPAPTPAPSPAPVPPPVDTTIPTTGLPMVADGLDVPSLLRSAGKMPDLAAPLDPGAFRLICHASHLSYNDPIVYPGQKGKSHLHQFFGNDSVDENSTYDSLRKAGNSTCGNALNRSGYWMPALLNGKGGVVIPDYVSIYYKRYDAKSVQCTQSAKACVQLPRGLRYIFGYDMLTMGAKATGGGYFNCDSMGMAATDPNRALVKPGHYKSIVEAAPNCPIGARLGAVISSPDCWNGKDLDSPDHRSHMAYQQRDVASGQMRCPSTHPYMVAQFTLGAWFSVDSTLDRSGTWNGQFDSWHLSSDNMPGMPMLPGTSFHTDWWGAWNDQIINLWHINCIEKLKSCTAAEIGDGTQLKQPADSWVAVPHVVPVPVRP